MLRQLGIRDWGCEGEKGEGEVEGGESPPYVRSEPTPPIEWDGCANLDQLRWHSTEVHVPLAGVLQQNVGGVGAGAMTWAWSRDRANALVMAAVHVLWRIL